VAAVGLPPIRLHDLRHTAASLALQAGVPLKVVSEQLGHSTITITADTYTSVLPEVATAAADAVAGIIPRKPVSSPKNASLADGSQGSPKEPKMTKRAQRKTRNVQVTGEVGSAPSGTRTPNPLIKRPQEPVPDADE
jgi:hypothetical protein